MQKRRLGISLYPERSTFEQDVAYMEKAAKLGFDLLFIALLGAGDRQQTIDRYKPLLAKAKELGFEIEADVNPMMFERMGINASFFHGPLDLSFFTELQVDILRLDLGLNDMEEAFLSKNKEGIKICVNGCNTQDHVGHVLAAGGDRDMILGCHNYYPHRYTGVSLEHLKRDLHPWSSTTCVCSPSLPPKTRRPLAPGPSPRVCPRWKCTVTGPLRSKWGTM